MSAAPTDPALVPAEANQNNNTNNHTNHTAASTNTTTTSNTNTTANGADAVSPQDSSTNPKERHSLTLDQRRALRRWANSQTIRPSHKACIEWFYAQYGQQISQSTVSHSLSPKYSRLDGDNPQLSGSRLRFGNWPDVEKLVLLWYQQVQASGRQPTNEELGEKAKSIFNQLPRYKDETSPEFSPGWIHRFKKRYGLLIRRQRRHGDGGIDPAEDIEYLADCVPRFMAIAADTSPAAIKEQVSRVVGVDSSLSICALVRDEILRRLNAHVPSLTSIDSAAAAAATTTTTTSTAVPSAQPDQPSQQQHQQQQQQQQQQSQQGQQGHHQPPPSQSQAAQQQHQHQQHQQPQPMFVDEDPEVVLQNALRDLQQQEQAAEEQAAAVREERERAERAGLQPTGIVSTPGPRNAGDARYATPGGDMTADLTLTPIHSDVPMGSHDRPLRCPFCVNQRMLRTIKEAVEHLSTHVVV
ncbi:CENP-B -like protein 1 [Escovopsis weberi]|uniref:CENP-B-like protein 1 n=1 Tax=Escovopsis weberi TaxID=150374 RepID=A0A0M8N494_ESCWE|nr:CENP-B -like protein 1 [Escovopsis weberi]